MTIYVKHMVSNRCKQRVMSELEQLDITGSSIELGKVELSQPLSNDQLEALRFNLAAYGLKVMPDRKVELVKKIKLVIKSMLADSENEVTVNHSEYISGKLKVQYASLARVFVETKGLTIKQYIIKCRIKFAKELIREKTYTLSQIAYRLNYSNIGHLSNQFKKLTGISPSFFKQRTRLNNDNLISQENANSKITIKQRKT